MREYEYGQAVKLIALYANEDGVATNPTTTIFQYGLRSVNPPPDPTATTLTFGVDGNVSNPSAGRFEAAITGLAPGIYTSRTAGTGAVAAAKVGAFRVKPSPFA
jgi:hypothetical protein